jgi:hypothetical protein
VQQQSANEPDLVVVEQDCTYALYAVRYCVCVEALLHYTLVPCVVGEGVTGGVEGDWRRQFGATQTEVKVRSLSLNDSEVLWSLNSIVFPTGTKKGFTDLYAPPHSKPHF